MSGPHEPSLPPMKAPGTTWSLDDLKDAGLQIGHLAIVEPCTHGRLRAHGRMVGGCPGPTYRPVDIDDLVAAVSSLEGAEVIEAWQSNGWTLVGKQPAGRYLLVPLEVR